jgi:hypothetical protein
MKKQRRLPWKPGRSAAENARELLPSIIGGFFAAGRKAARGAALPALHRFRLRVKRFRYTLELFRPCYGPTLDQKLKSLRGIQDCLGKMSDLAIVIRLGPATPVAARARRDLAAAARSFERLWRQFDAPGAESRWSAYLRKARPARRKV